MKPSGCLPQQHFGLRLPKSQMISEHLFMGSWTSGDPSVVQWSEGQEWSLASAGQCGINLEQDTFT